MESKSLGAQYRKQTYYVVAFAGLLILVGFSIVEYIRNDAAAMWTDAVTALIVAGSLLALRLGNDERVAYRLGCWGSAMGLLCLVLTGDGLLYYQLIFPLLAFYFLGRREGMVLVGIFFVGLTGLMSAAEMGLGNDYRAGNTMRFLVGCFFVTVVGWSYEKSRERFHTLLATKNDGLQHEKNQLQQALNQVKEKDIKLEQTLSELKSQTQLMQTVFDNMDEGVAVSDPEGKLLLFNPSAERILGMGAVESGPDEWSEIYGAFYLDKETPVPPDQLPLVRALRGETTDGMELFVRNDKNWEGAYVSAKGRYIPNDDGADKKVKAGVVVFSDITRHKKQETELQETIKRLRKQAQLMETVFRSVSDGIVVTGKDGGFLFVNPAAKEIVGMGETDNPPDQWAETYGTFYADRTTPIPSNELPLVRAMQGEPSNDVELFIRNRERPEGVSINVSARPLKDDTGMIEGGVIVLRDITRLKAAETELRETVRHFQDQTHLMETVFNSVSDGVVVVDEKKNTLIFNRSAKRILGLHVPDTSFSQWAATYGIFSVDGKALMPEDKLPIVRAVRGESSDGVELLVRNRQRPAGVYISSNGRPLMDDSAAIKGGVVTFRDVTEIKKAERELEQTTEDLRNQTHAMETIFNSISDGVVVADENGNFSIFNPSAERIVGIGGTDSGPDQWTKQYGIFFPDRVTPFPTGELPLVRAIQGEPSDEVEMFIRNSNVPEGVYISVSGRPLQDDSGWTKGGVIVFRDVTERLRAEEALAQAFAQGRLEIVDTILHNIGNAINSVTIGVGTIREQLVRNDLIHRLSALAKTIEAHRGDWIQFLQSDPQGQQVLPFILALAKDFAAQNAQLTQTAERVGSRVAHIVDIIRTQRSLDSGSMARKDINVRKTIVDSVKVLQDSITKRGITIGIDCENAPQEIRIQESKFHQMLINLVKNAIEAIDELQQSSGLEAEPRIQVRVYVQEDFLVVDVIDNGIGIEEKLARIIFRAGYTSKKGGSGLGLHSIANFVIGSGGQIHPFSAGPGKGTTMRVKLRMASVALGSKDPRRGNSQ